MKKLLVLLIALDIFLGVAIYFRINYSGHCYGDSEEAIQQLFEEVQNYE